MNKFVKFSILFFIVCGIFLLAAPVRWFPSFYDVRYMGIAAFVCAAAIIFLPKLLRVESNMPGAEQKNRAADFLQLGITISVMNNALGDMGLYQLYKFGFEYDKLIHFATSVLAVLIISIVLRDRFGVRASYAIAVAFVAVILFGFLWELFEYTSDALLKTHIYGVYGADQFHDTTWDLISNTIGALAGVAVMFFKNRRKAAV